MAQGRPDGRVGSGRPAGADEPDTRAGGSTGSRMAWFVGLWLAGVVAVGAAAFAIRFLLWL